MSGGMSRRQISCEFKEAFPTLDAANQFIRDVNSSGRLRAYHCSYCTTWHIADSKKVKPFKRKKGDQR